MAGPTTEVMNSDLKDLGRKVEELGRDISGLRVAEAETRTTVKNAGWLIGLLLLGLLTLVGTGLYRAGGLASQVQSIDVRLDKSEAKLDERLNKLEINVNTRFDKLEAKLDERFNKLEAKVDARLDKLEAKVDASLKLVLDRLMALTPTSASSIKP